MRITKKMLSLLLITTMVFSPMALVATAYEYSYTYAYYGEEESTEDAGVLFDATILMATQSIEAIMEQFSIPGLTIALVDSESNFTWTQGFGYADITSRRPVDENTLFHIASTSKPFTAVAIMQLVEEGLLDLDRPIVYYLPEFRVQPHPVYGGDSRLITTRMLLTHMSSIPGDLFSEYSLTRDGHNWQDINNLLDTMSTLFMQNEVAERMAYANNGYLLLSVLISRLRGYDDYAQGFENNAQQNLFAPMGMNLSSFQVRDLNRPLLAMPHVDSSTRAIFEYVNSAPTGGMITNATDMARFMHMILNGGEIDGNRILSQASLNEMLRPQDFDFSRSAPLTMGLGFMNFTMPDGFSTTGHGGNLEFFHTDTVFHLETGVGVFVAVNSMSGAPIASQLAHVVLQSAAMERGFTPLIPDFDFEGLVPIERPAEELERYVGFYPPIGHVVLVDGTLFIEAAMGLPPMTPLTPMANGSFDLLEIDRLWFREVNGNMQILQGDIPFAYVSEREEPPSPIDYNYIIQWIGHYHPPVIGSFFHSIRIGHENGIAYMELHAMGNQVLTFPIERVDNYTFFVMGRGRNLGTVLEFSIVDGVPTLDISGGRFIKDTIPPHPTGAVPSLPNM